MEPLLPGLFLNNKSKVTFSLSLCAMSFFTSGAATACFFLALNCTWLIDAFLNCSNNSSSCRFWQLRYGSKISMYDILDKVFNDTTSLVLLLIVQYYLNRSINNIHFALLFVISVSTERKYNLLFNRLFSWKVLDINICHLIIHITIFLVKGLYINENKYIYIFSCGLK